METEYGAFEGSDNVVRALASLAFIHYGGDYIRDELLSALSILEKGDIGPRAMVGSWAGAMGQTQFMPSSFRDYAVDFDGGGRRDIWNNAADAIGSMANYLAKHGWKRDLPWGFEVRLPSDFKLSARDSTVPAEFESFAKRGVERADGGAMPTSGEARRSSPRVSKVRFFSSPAISRRSGATTNPTLTPWASACSATRSRAGPACERPGRFTTANWRPSKSENCKRASRKWVMMLEKLMAGPARSCAARCVSFKRSGDWRRMDTPPWRC